MIYQHVNKRTKILPRAFAHIAHLCNQLNRVSAASSMPRFKSINFIKNLELSYFVKNCKFFVLGAKPPDPRISSGGWEFRPQAPNIHPIASFWLRAW